MDKNRHKIIKDTLSEGINLPKSGEFASGLENKLRVELEKYVGDIYGLSVTGNMGDIQVSCKMNTLIGSIVFQLDYRPGNGYNVKFSNDFKFRVAGENKEQIMNTSKGMIKKAKMVSETHEILFDVFDRVFK